MAEPRQIAEAFLQHFIAGFDSEPALGRQALAPLYTERSMLTYEGQEMQGTEAIINFFANPESGSPISRFCTKTAVTTFDVQPTGPDMSSLLVYVTGNIQVQGEEEGKEQKYSHVFVLSRDAGGNFTIDNEMFRLSLM